MYNTWKEFSGLSGEIEIPPNNRFHLQGKVQSLGLEAWLVRLGVWCIIACLYFTDSQVYGWNGTVWVLCSQQASLSPDCYQIQVPCVVQVGLLCLWHSVSLVIIKVLDKWSNRVWCWAVPSIWLSSYPRTCSTILPASLAPLLCQQGASWHISSCHCAWLQTSSANACLLPSGTSWWFSPA